MTIPDHANPNKPTVSYYQRHKDEAWFKEYRKAWSIKYRAQNETFRTWQHIYNQHYYAVNKEKIDKARKAYPDRTRNERVKKFLRNEREALADNYIIKLLMLSHKCKAHEITPSMIEQKRNYLIKRREKVAMQKS